MFSYRYTMFFYQKSKSCAIIFTDLPPWEIVFSAWDSKDVSLLSTTACVSHALLKEEWSGSALSFIFHHFRYLKGIFHFSNHCHFYERIKGSAICMCQMAKYASVIPHCILQSSVHIHCILTPKLIFTGKTLFRDHSHFTYKANFKRSFRSGGDNHKIPGSESTASNVHSN